MHPGVRRVGELVGREVTVITNGHLAGKVYRALDPFGRFGEYHFGAEKPYEFLPLRAHVFRHHDGDVVAFKVSQPRQRYPGIAGSGFQYGLAGFKPPALLGIFYNGQRHPVLDAGASSGILTFQFTQDSVVLDDAGQVHQRRMSDCGCDVCIMHNLCIIHQHMTRLKNKPYIYPLCII